MSDYKRIGDYIEKVDKRNKSEVVKDLKGINIEKYFMPSVANVVGTDLSRYKIVKPGEFACNRMHVGRDYKLPVALSEYEEDIIVSPAYDVFRITNQNTLLPEYLMMWFSRDEFDRNAWFYTDTDVRGKLGWEDFCNMKLPVPPLEKQQKIVQEYQSINKRIQLNEKLIQKLEESAQAIYKHWFVDFEFPMTKEYAESIGKPELEGKPYKSNGGEMVWNEELGKEVPKEWEVGKIEDLFILQRGHDLPTQDRIDGEYPIFASMGITEYHSEFKIEKPTIITGRSGSLGELFYYDQPCWPLNTTLYINEFLKATPFYSLFFLQTVNLKELGAGSAVPTLNRNDIHAIHKELPNENVMKLFDKKISIIHSNKKNNDFQIQKLEDFKNVLLSKIATIEN